MEIKLFGRSLFSFQKSVGGYLIAQASSQNKESKFLPDFHEVGSQTAFYPISDIAITGIVDGHLQKRSEEKKVAPSKIKLTPKGVFDLQMLHDKTFKLNTDPLFVDQQIEDFKDKLGLIKSEEYDMHRGVNEIASILLRFENRKRYPEVKEFFEQYPYTQSSKIEALVKEHDYLKLGQVAQFLAQMPKEAIEAMKNYNKSTNQICGKQAVFYIVADKKDFEKTQQRRDPILLAQSPFGHFWQIIGAWDKEMLFVEEL